MTRIFSFCVLLTAFCATGTAIAQQGPDATALAKSVAPFIDDVTVAVFHVDFSQIQVEPLVEKATGWFPEQRSQLKAMTPLLSAPLEKLNAAGTTEFYGVVSLAGPMEPDNFVFFVIPLSDESDEKAITQIVRQTLGDSEFESERLHGALVFGTTETLVRLRSIVPDERPELPAALQTMNGTVAHAILLPPKHTCRVVEEIMPELPQALGGGPSSVLTDGILWAAVGVELEPKISVSGVIQSRDTASAQRLQPKFKDLCRLLASDEKTLREIPQIEILLQLLIPDVWESRSILKINEDLNAFEAWIAAIRATLAE